DDGPRTDVLEPTRDRPAVGQAPTGRPPVSPRAQDRAAPRVMVVDHDPVRRARLAALVDQAPDLDLLGSTSNLVITRVLLDRLDTVEPDVVLVAVDVPD